MPGIQIHRLYMEKGKYRKLLNEVFGLMKGEKLDAALQESKSAARVDAVQDLMRAAIIRSSICKFNGTPYYFSGRIYEEMAWDDFGNLIYDLMRKCKMPNGDYSRVEGVLKVCKRVVAGKALKPDNAIVVFNNCVFDMNARRAHSFNRRWVQTTCVPYDYKPEEHVFLWRMFLDEVLPDKNMQKVLQEFLGSIFVDRRVAKMETMLVLRGSGSNGKDRYISCRVSSTCPASQCYFIDNSFSFSCNGLVLSIFTLFHFYLLVFQSLLVHGFQASFLFFV